MGLKDQLQTDMKDAMRTGDAQRRDVLRMTLAAVKQVEVDERKTLDDAGVEDVVRKQIKQRRESIADMEKAGRTDEIAQETAAVALLESYLPQMMTREEVESAAKAVISELNVTDPKSIGQVMARLMPELKGRADGRMVNEVVRDLLK